MHGGSIGGLAELVEDGGLPGHETNSGQGVQMQPVVLATNQEEQVRRLAVGRAKMDFLNGATQEDERTFKQPRVGHAGMEKGKAARHAGGTKSFAGFQTGHQVPGVVQSSGCFRQLHQLMQNGRLGFSGQGRGNEAGLDHVRQEGLARQDFPGPTGGFSVILRQPLAGEAEEVLGSPKVNFVLGKNDPASAFLVRNLVAFDAFLDVSRGQVQILRDSVKTENLIGHSETISSSSGD